MVLSNEAIERQKTRKEREVFEVYSKKSQKEAESRLDSYQSRKNAVFSLTSNRSGTRLSVSWGLEQKPQDAGHIAVIRFVRLLRAGSGLGADAFDEYRRDKLGPRIAGLQLELGLVRYVQSHRSDGSASVEKTFLALRPGASNEFGGVEEFWWRNEATALGALSDPGGAWAELMKIQDPWIDHAGSPGWLAVDYPQVATSTSRQVAAPKTGLLKLTFAISPLQSLGESKARRYWLVEHGPLIRSLAPARGALAYIQVHRQGQEGEAAAKVAGVPAKSPYMGHAEAWFNEVVPGAGADGQAAVRAAVADEQNFIDWSRSSVFVGKELVFVDRNWL